MRVQALFRRNSTKLKVRGGARGVGRLYKKGGV